MAGASGGKSGCWIMGGGCQAGLRFGLREPLKIWVIQLHRLFFKQKHTKMTTWRPLRQPINMLTACLLRVDLVCKQNSKGARWPLCTKKSCLVSCVNVKIICKNNTPSQRVEAWHLLPLLCWWRSALCVYLWSYFRYWTLDVAELFIGCLDRNIQDVLCLLCDVI